MILFSHKTKAISSYLYHLSIFETIFPPVCVSCSGEPWCRQTLLALFSPARLEVELNLPKEASRVNQIAVSCMWQIIFCDSALCCAAVSLLCHLILSPLPWGMCFCYHIVHNAPRPNHQQLVLKPVQVQMFSLEQLYVLKFASIATTWFRTLYLLMLYI